MKFISNLDAKLKVEGHKIKEIFSTHFHPAEGSTQNVKLENGSTVTLVPSTIAAVKAKEQIGEIETGDYVLNHPDGTLEVMSKEKVAETLTPLEPSAATVAKTVV